MIVLYPSPPSTLETGSSIEPAATVSFPQALELQACGQPTLAFYMEAGDLNLGHLSISALKVLIIGKPSLSLFKKKII